MYIKNNLVRNGVNNGVHWRNGETKNNGVKCHTRVELEMLHKIP